MIHLRSLRRLFYKAIMQPLYAFRVFKKRISAFVYYICGGGKSGLPEAITLFLTHRCNLRCRMCGQWGEGGFTKAQGAQYVQAELTLDMLKSIIDKVSSFKPNITLFGGEPLLYDNCIEVIKYIKKRSMHCLMITNGSLLHDIAKEIIDSGLDELNISLDGGPEIHDAIRGMQGLYDRIEKGIMRIKYFKDEARAKKPYINLQCTITKYNYKHLEQLIEVAGKVGADSVTFHNLIFLSKELLDKQKRCDALLGCESAQWEGFVFEPGIEVKVLYEKIKKILSGRYRFNVDFYPNFSLQELTKYYNQPSYSPAEYKARCLSPWVTAYIFPDGEVRPCLNSNYSYGNVKNSSFRELWNNEKAVRFRTELKNNSMFPVCARCTELYRY